MLQSLLFQRPWRPPGNQQLQTWQNKSMNRMDASLFDYKNRDQAHFSVTTKAFSLCQKLPYILSNLRDIYTSSTIHCQLQRRINATFTRHWTNFARFRKFVRLGFPFTRFRKEFVICFISQWMKRSKHGFFVFPPKKTLMRRRHCSIGQSCCSMTSKRSIGWFVESFSGMKFFHQSVRLNNQRPHTFVSVR